MAPLRERLMKTRKYVWSAGKKGENCSICLEELINGDGMAVIPVCEHSFHDRCLK